MSTTPPNLFSIEDAPSSGFEIVDNRPVTGDTAMAEANTRMALANVPRPKNPIPSEVNLAPSTALAAGDVIKNMAIETPRSIWDTSLGSMVNAYQRGTGPAVTPQQIQAQARLKAAIPNSILNYLMAASGNTGAIKRAPNLTGRLLNASGDISPQTLENLNTVKPVLEAAGPPAVKTQAGMAQHLTNQSLAIQNRIAPIIEQNAAKDVSSTTAQIASDLRSQITPAMKRTNPGVANSLERYAKGAEESKTLGELDDFRKQLEGRRDALKPGSIGKPYVYNALNSVLDGIADHVQQVQPSLDVRALRSTQKALMQLSSTFEESGAKGQALQAAKEGMTPRQKLAQFFPDIAQAAMNPKAALVKRMIQPVTAEEMIQRAYAGQPQSAAGQLARSVTAPPDMPPASPFDVARMANKAAAMDPALKSLDAQLRQRAAAFQQQREALGPLGLESQQTFNPSPNPADIPPAQPYYQRYGQAAEPATPNTAEATGQHMTAFEMAKARLGPNATIGDILQEAAKIQNPK